MENKNCKKIKAKSGFMLKMKEEENKITNFIYRNMKIGENHQKNKFFYRSQSLSKNEIYKNNNENNIHINLDENVKKSFE